MTTSPPLTGPSLLRPCALLVTAAVWYPGIAMPLPVGSCASCTAKTSTLWPESQRETSGIFFLSPSAFQLASSSWLLALTLRRYLRFFALRLRPPRGPDAPRTPVPPPLALAAGGGGGVHLISGPGPRCTRGSQARLMMEMEMVTDEVVAAAGRRRIGRRSTSIPPPEAGWSPFGWDGRSPRSTLGARRPHRPPREGGLHRTARAIVVCRSATWSLKVS